MLEILIGLDLKVYHIISYMAQLVRALAALTEDPGSDSVLSFPFFLSFFLLYTVFCMSVGQKRAQDRIADGCKSPRGYWELNSELLSHLSILQVPILRAHMEPHIQPRASVALFWPS